MVSKIRKSKLQIQAKFNLNISCIVEKFPHLCIHKRNEMNIQLIKDYAKRQLRAEFDEANGWEAIGIIDRTKEMGFDELAADMEKDLKTDSDFHKQVNSGYNDSISEGARL